MSYFNTLTSWKKQSLKKFLPPPLKAEHGEYSMIFSLHDQPQEVTPELLSLSLKAIEFAMNNSLSHLASRGESAKMYADLWPGEHYRLLSGLVQALQPKLVVEIGTSKGLSALSMKNHLPKKGRILTFDIVPWVEVPNTLLRQEDFDDQFIQYVEDLSDPSKMEEYEAILQDASLIFIDVTHDGDLEEKILNNLKKVKFGHPVYVLFDDIRVWTMLKMWREIALPKIDLTSFGHWSGTGLVRL